MAEERVVFDFTSEEFWNTFEEDYFNKAFRNYLELIDSKKRTYTRNARNGKIQISIISESGKVYICIYYEKKLEDIRKAIKSTDFIDLKGFYIENFDTTEIDEYDELKIDKFDASYSFFEGNTDFSNTNFGECEVNFTGAIFGDGDLNFCEVIFGGIETKFDHVAFGNGNKDFSNSCFGSLFSSFFGANFAKGDVRFLRTTFPKGLLTFSTAKFGKGDISFSDAKFGEIDVDFMSTEFGNGNFNFYGVEFLKGKMDFREAVFGRGEIVFFNSRLENCNICLENVDFGKGEFSCDLSDVSKLYYSLYCQKDHWNLQFNSIKELRICECVIESSIRISGDPQILSLEGTINLGQIHFSDKPSIIVSAIENSFKGDKHLSIKQKLDQLTLIKENYHALGEYDGEDLAYQTYMKYKTKFMKKGIKKFFFWLFGKIGKYGTAPGNIIAWAGGVAVSLGLIYWPFMANQTESAVKCNFLKGLYFSIITFLTIGYGDIAPPNTLIAFIAGLEGFLGLFFMAYFTVAVVRKLLR